MDTVMTPDGVVTIWDSARDIADICGQYVGYSFAKYVYEVINDGDLEKEQARLRFNSDFNAMEQEVEGYRNELYDMKEELEQLMNEVDDKPGMSKKKVMERVELLWQHLQKIL